VELQTAVGKTTMLTAVISLQKQPNNQN